MAAIKGKDTKPELIVRQYLWKHGFRYRLNHPRLPGRPDIVLRKYRTCIFVNGCFWHGHNVILNENYLQSTECCKIPKTNREFWVNKIIRNKQRDERNKAELRMMGWNVITLWECQLRKKQQREIALIDLVAELRGQHPYRYSTAGYLSWAAEEEILYNT